MNINKKLGLLALPLLAAGTIGVAAVSGTPSAHAATPSPASSQSQQQGADTPEPNDTPDSNKSEATKDTDNIQQGPQDETGAPDVNQSDGETAN